MHKKQGSRVRGFEGSSQNARPPDPLTPRPLGPLIVAEARTWLGTPFRHQGMTKGVGCDCAGLIRSVMEAVIAGKYTDAWDYPHRPHAPTLIGMLNKYLMWVPIAEIQPGDILLFKIDTNPQHLAIKTDKGIIHAYARGPRRVEEVSFTSPWPERLVGAWRISESKSPLLAEKVPSLLILKVGMTQGGSSEGTSHE